MPVVEKVCGRSQLMLVLFYGVFAVNVAAQDRYHQELIQELENLYQVTDPNFVLYDTESAIRDNKYLYGDATQTHLDVENFAFSIQTSINVFEAGENIWDTGTGLNNVQPVAAGDAVLFTFWAKQNSSSSGLNVFIENATTFAKEAFFSISFSSDWAQYFVPFEATQAYAAGELTFGFHLAAQVQEISIGGFTALNYGSIDIDQLPSTIAPERYGGFEADAAWRFPAQERIDSLRKSRLEVSIVDGSGNPISDAQVQIKMRRHAFGFGSAVVTGRFPGNRNANETYVDRIFDLDGAGHGFNEVVTENALKWDGWEEEWIGTPEETLSAIRMLSDSGLTVRGHTLVWPGWSHLPSDMESNQTDLEYMRGRMSERIMSMLTHPELSEIITEWDVLNEITQVRDLEKAFDVDQTLESGREIYQEILAQVNEVQPEFTHYINDYVVLSGGGSGQSVVDRYTSYLDEIEASGVRFDGIGFQCHIGTQPTSILKVEEVLDEFFLRYGKRMKITEYDINPSVDEETQARYLDDFLTMVFSHPGVDAFIMWGFWDGNHWKQNAPIFNLDWSVKPSGQVFFDKVFGEWWTDSSFVSSDVEMVQIPVFNGEHEIIVSYNGEVDRRVFSTDTTSQMRFVFESTSTRDESLQYQFSVGPNPSRGTIALHGDLAKISALAVYSLNGRHLMDCAPEHRLALDLPPGVYFLRITTRRGIENHRMVIAR